MAVLQTWVAGVRDELCRLSVELLFAEFNYEWGTILVMFTAGNHARHRAKRTLFMMLNVMEYKVATFQRFTGRQRYGVGVLAFIAVVV